MSQRRNKLSSMTDLVRHTITFEWRPTDLEDITWVRLGRRWSRLGFSLDQQLSVNWNITNWTFEWHHTKWDDHHSYQNMSVYADRSNHSNIAKRLIIMISVNIIIISPLLRLVMVMAVVAVLLIIVAVVLASVLFQLMMLKPLLSSILLIITIMFAITHWSMASQARLSSFSLLVSLGLNTMIIL